MYKSFTLACIASVGLATNAKVADMLANRQVALGAPTNAKIASLAQNNRVLESNTKLAQVSVQDDEPPFIPTREEAEFLELV